MWQKWLCVAILILAGNAMAGDEVLVDKVWLRETVPGQQSASLQLNLTATKPAKLVSVSTAWAESVEIQRLSPARGKIKARVVPSLSLPRNRAVVFGERSFSLMMVGLKQPLVVGDLVPVTMMVEFSGKRVRVLEVKAEVKALELSYKHYGGKVVHDHR
jgi:copper(I)-binding protein